MKRSLIICLGLILAVASAWGVVRPWAGVAGPRPFGVDLPEGVYIDLTRDFYEALQEGTSAGGKVYSNSTSEEYLRQVAVSTKFMVETNLQILRQQEMVIRLLRSLLDPSRSK